MESLRKKPSPSQSTTSCIISTLDVTSVSDEVLKDPEQEANPKLQLDLKQATSDCDDDRGGFINFNQELNLIDSLNKLGSSDSTATETPQPTDSEQRVFSCNYCQRKFYSSQALGGHQNAHRRERTLAKKTQRMGAVHTGFGHPYFHHNHYPSAYNRSMGIEVHSMIHKNSNISSSNGFKNVYRQLSWCRLPIIEQQPAIGKLSMENSHAISSVGRFNNTMRLTMMGSSADEQKEIQKVDLSLKL